MSDSNSGVSPNTLFVGRIDQGTRQPEIEELFGKFGKLRRCFLKEKGAQSYAFVTFEDPADAQKAFDEMQGYEINGTKLNIEKARSSDRARQPRGPPRGNYSSYPPPQTGYGGYGGYPPPPSHYYPPPYPYDPRASHYPPPGNYPPPRGSSCGGGHRRSRSRSPPRGGYPSSGYDYHQRGPGGYDYGGGYYPSDPNTAAGYGPPPSAGYDPYAAYGPNTYSGGGGGYQSSSSHRGGRSGRSDRSSYQQRNGSPTRGSRSDEINGDAPSQSAGQSKDSSSAGPSDSYSSSRDNYGGGSNQNSANESASYSNSNNDSYQSTTA